MATKSMPSVGVLVLDNGLIPLGIVLAAHLHDVAQLVPRLRAPRRPWCPAAAEAHEAAAGGRQEQQRQGAPAAHTALKAHGLEPQRPPHGAPRPFWVVADVPKAHVSAVGADQAAPRGRPAACRERRSQG